MIKAVTAGAIFNVDATNARKEMVASTKAVVQVNKNNAS